MARRYEFYVRVAETISHSFAALTRETSFLPREHKIHIFEPTCDVLFIIWRPDVIEIADFYFIVFENRASFTNHRSSSQKIQSNRIQDIETLTEFQTKYMKYLSTKYRNT